MTNLSIGLAALLILALALLLLPLSQKQRATKDKTIQKSVLIIALFIPLFSISMYFILGTPQFAEIAAQQSPAPVQTLVDKLQAKLQKKPNDVDGWLLLGRSYEVTKEHDKAIYAFEKALALQPNNLQAILPLAESIALQQSGSLLGRPYELLIQAYSIAPDNPMTLWLLGMVEKEQNNPTQAQYYWQTLYQQLAEGSEDKIAVKKLLNDLDAQASTNMHTTKSDSTRASASQTATEQNIAPSQNADHIQIHFEIDPESLQKIADATIFIYLKEPKGMPMPIAAKRYLGKNLPNKVIISPVDELLPNRSIRNYNPLILGVKITQGDANSRINLYQKEITINTNEQAKLIIKL